MMPLRVPWLVCVLVALAACEGGSGGGGDGARPPGAGPRVGLSGAQDAGRFRALLEAGQVPGPDTLEAAGFFAEHALTWPAADCGDDLCLHAQLVVAPSLLDGSNVTRVVVGMNSALDPAAMPERSLHLALVVDVSASMAGEPLRDVQRGVRRLLASLRPDDRVTLVTYAATARVQASAVPADSPLLTLDALDLGGGTDLYDAVALAHEALADASAVPETAGLERRVLLLSDGEATAGITNPARLTRLAAAWAEREQATSAVAFRARGDGRRLEALVTAGGGNLYFVDDAAALEEVFAEEAAWSLLPLARDARLRFVVRGPYRWVRALGASGARLGAHQGVVEVPALNLAHRRSPSDATYGRRGGGGAIVLELWPELGPDTVLAPHDVADVSLSWTAPSGDKHESTVHVASPLPPGVVGDAGDAEFFATDTARKAHLMAELFVGFELATRLAGAGDDATALGVLLQLERGVAAGLASHPDLDLEDDGRLLALFVALLRARGAADPPPTWQPPGRMWVYR